MTEKQTVNENKKMPLTRTISGGVLGATIGYLATPENRKKLIAGINDSEWKEKGLDLGKAAKGKVSKLKDAGKKKSQAAYQRVKDANVFSNGKNDSDQESDDNVTTELVNEESFMELKEENKLLQERLKNLEERLNKIASCNEEESNNSPKAQNSQHADSNNQNFSSNQKENSMNDNQSEDSGSMTTAISNNDDTNTQRNKE
ncbi:YtxH domain-containing protein [Gracilibacillus oryzae]|uniref:YtxH domain-containing protein n=1 Tax=Gracilibacillus oryzae TaxID=1672701 RepID=A0A7C8GVF5_9BACI|nr:YtxH domain-containing protein [Gracilibacillus oryzae]KAB8139225.1 YtxH domain-containing protein [Gracilibacillus oryzae]